MSRTLLIDVGNSRVKWAFAEAGVLAPSQARVHEGEPASVVEAMPVQPVQAIRIANVTGAAHAHALAQALAASYACQPQFAVSETAQLGLRSAYAEPGRLGVDRWLAMLAAWTRAHAAVCVASAGTALTFDAVDASGQHRGGIIASGLLTAQQAVLGATRFAAAGPDRHYASGLGADTEACVRQGALHACAGLLERLAAREAGAQCFLTGGDAETLLPHLAGTWTVVPDLVLEGLLALN